MIIIYLYPVVEPCTDIVLTDPTVPVPVPVPVPDSGGPTWRARKVLPKKEIVPVPLTHYRLRAEPGRFVATGHDASLLAHRGLHAETGRIGVTGGDSALVVAREALHAEPGQYALRGSDATLLRSYVLHAEGGKFAATLSGHTSTNRVTEDAVARIMREDDEWLILQEAA